MLQFAPGVRVNYWHPRLTAILEYASAWGALRAAWVDVIAIDDHDHDAGTLHGFSLAVDFDIAAGLPGDRKNLHGWLSRYLPIEYRVRLERDRVHVELDARPGSHVGGEPPIPLPTPPG